MREIHSNHGKDGNINTGETGVGNLFFIFSLYITKF